MAKILVAGDRAVNREVVVTLLGHGGHQVLEAADGKTALEWMKLHHPNLLITNILLPSIDGPELVRRVRLEQATADTPVIFYTAIRRERAVREIARACGVHYVITKSSDPQDILKIVAMALGKANSPASVLSAEDAVSHSTAGAADNIMAKAAEPTTTGLRLAALVDAGLVLASEPDPDRLVEKFCRAAQDIIGAQYASAGVLNESGQLLRHTFFSELTGDWGAQQATQPLSSGILGTLLASKRPLRLRDLSGDPQDLGLPAEYPPFHTFLGVPVGTMKEASGWLYLCAKSGADEFSEEDEHLAEMLAAQFVVAYENATVRKKLQATLQETWVINEVARIITSTVEIGEVYERFAQEAKKLVDFDRITMNVVNQDEGTFTYKYVSGLMVPGRHVGDSAPLAGSQIKESMLDLRSQVWNDLGAPPHVNKVPEIARLGIRSSIVVPLVAKGTVIGVLDLWSCKREAFGLREQAILESLANQIAPAVENSDLHQQRSKELEQRRLAELAVRESEEKYRALSYSAIDAIISGDSSGKIVSWNRGAQAIFGYAEEEVLGKPLSLLMPDRYRDAHQIGIQRVSSGGESKVIGKTVELHGRRKDGTEFPLELSLSTWKTSKSTFFTGIIRDTTDRKSIENQLRQAQKMEAVGRLAGGVAHDFNNLLTPIIGYIDLAIEAVPRDQPLYEDLNEIRNAAQMASSLTRQLLAFSRHQVLEPKALDLNDLVLNIGKLLQRVIGEDIKLSTKGAPDLWTIRADPGQLEQVLMNLAVNARDAMPKGGFLTIETVNVELDEQYTRQHEDVAPGDYVLLAVSDNGTGMTDEVKAHLFEPFFTTKEQGKGTGLGLATCYGIIKQSGGHLSAYSQVGQGTTFKVYLPATSEAKTAAGHEPERRSPTGTEVVLLVEDNASVRRIATRILRRQGYTVLETAGGAAALQLAGEHKDQIQLLLTDVVMPSMNGPELAQRLRVMCPDINVLFMSGYTADAITRHGVLEPGVMLLHKPFTPQALALKVREVLDRKS